MNIEKNCMGGKYETIILSLYKYRYFGKNSKSLCFTNLDLVDDLDEVETSDIKKFGRFCYVSCWTKEE